MRLRRALLLAIVGGGLVAAGLAYAQVPPTGAGPPGWLNAIFNVLGDGATTGGPRTVIDNSGTGTTGAVAATLTAAATGKTAFLCGYAVTLSNPTTATNITVTSTGLSANLSEQRQVLAAAATVPPPADIRQTFSPCLPASAINTNIVITQPGLGAGATGASTSAWGYLR